MDDGKSAASSSVISTGGSVLNRVRMLETAANAMRSTRDSRRRINAVHPFNRPYKRLGQHDNLLGGAENSIDTSEHVATFQDDSLSTKDGDRNSPLHTERVDKTDRRDDDDDLDISPNLQLGNETPRDVPTLEWPMVTGFDEHQGTRDGRHSKINRLQAIRSRSPNLFFTSKGVKRDLISTNPVREERLSSAGYSDASHSTLGHHEMESINSRAHSLARVSKSTRKNRLEGSPLHQIVKEKRTKTTSDVPKMEITSVDKHRSHSPVIDEDSKRSMSGLLLRAEKFSSLTRSCASPHQHLEESNLFSIGSSVALNRKLNHPVLRFKNGATETVDNEETSSVSTLSSREGVLRRNRVDAARAKIQHNHFVSKHSNGQKHDEQEGNHFHELRVPQHCCVPSREATLHRHDRQCEASASILPSHPMFSQSGIEPRSNFSPQTNLLPKSRIQEGSLASPGMKKDFLDTLAQSRSVSPSPVFLSRSESSAHDGTRRPGIIKNFHDFTSSTPFDSDPRHMTQVQESCIGENADSQRYSDLSTSNVASSNTKSRAKRAKHLKQSVDKMRQSRRLNAHTENSLPDTAVIAIDSELPPQPDQFESDHITLDLGVRNTSKIANSDVKPYRRIDADRCQDEQIVAGRRPDPEPQELNGTDLFQSSVQVMKPDPDENYAIRRVNYRPSSPIAANVLLPEDQPNSTTNVSYPPSAGFKAIDARSPAKSQLSPRIMHDTNQHSPMFRARSDAPVTQMNMDPDSIFDDDVESASEASRFLRPDAREWLKKTYGETNTERGDVIEADIRHDNVKQLPDPMSGNFGCLPKQSPRRGKHEDDIFSGLDEDTIFRSDKPRPFHRVEETRKVGAKPHHKENHIDESMVSMTMAPPPPPPPPPPSAIRRKKQNATLSSANTDQLQNNKKQEVISDPGPKRENVSIDVHTSLQQGAFDESGMESIVSDLTSSIVGGKQPHGQRFHKRRVETIEEEPEVSDEDRSTSSPNNQSEAGGGNVNNSYDDTSFIDTEVASQDDSTSGRRDSSSIFLSLGCAIADSFSRVCNLEPDQNSLVASIFNSTQEKCFYGNPEDLCADDPDPSVGNRSISPSAKRTRNNIPDEHIAVSLNPEERRLWQEWDDREHSNNIQSKSTYPQSRHEEERSEAQRKLIDYANRALAMQRKRTNHPRNLEGSSGSKDNSLDISTSSSKLNNHESEPESTAKSSTSKSSRSQHMPLTSEQTRMLTSVSATLRTEGVKALKLNRHMKWQVRFLVVSRDPVVYGRDSFRNGKSLCPKALLWLKSGRVNGYHSVSEAKPNGQGGLLFANLLRVEQVSDTDQFGNRPRRARKEFPEFYGLSIEYSFEGGNRKVLFSFQSLEELDAFATAIRIIKDVNDREITQMKKAVKWDDVTLSSASEKGNQAPQSVAIASI